MSKGDRGQRAHKRFAPPPAAVAAVAVLAVAAVLGVVYASSREADERAVNTSPRSAVPGLSAGDAPWPAYAFGLAQRAAASDVPFSDMEGTALHIHPRVRVLIDGREIPVPSEIGIEPDGTMAALHTHDDSGLIHVESPVVRAYNLGELFDVWGVRLTGRCVGSYCSTASKKLEAFVEARRFGGDPRDLGFKDGEQITLAYGTPEENRSAAGS